MFASGSDENPYLQQEVMSASPVRLRWMLIRRAEELCAVVQHCQTSGRTQEAQQWLLRIREILGELLEGVTDSGHPLGKTVADFYVFLIQLVNEIEQSDEDGRLLTLQELLGIESETWRQVLVQTSTGQTAGSEPESASAMLDGHSPLGLSGKLAGVDDDLLAGGGAFSLEV